MILIFVSSKRPTLWPLLPKIGRHESLWKYFQTNSSYLLLTNNLQRKRQIKEAGLTWSSCSDCAQPGLLSPLLLRGTCLAPEKDHGIEQYLSVDDLLQELGRDSPGFLVAALQRERRCERGTELGTLRRKLGRLPSLASWGSELDLWPRFISSYLHW